MIARPSESLQPLRIPLFPLHQRCSSWNLLHLWLACWMTRGQRSTFCQLSISTSNLSRTSIITSSRCDLAALSSTSSMMICLTPLVSYNQWKNLPRSCLPTGTSSRSSLFFGSDLRVKLPNLRWISIGSNARLWYPASNSEKRRSFCGSENGGVKLKDRHVPAVSSV